MGTECQCGKMRKFSREMVVMAAPQVNVPDATKLDFQKWLIKVLNFTFCVFYHHLKKFKAGAHEE